MDRFMQCMLSVFRLRAHKTDTVSQRFSRFCMRGSGGIPLGFNGKSFCTGFLE